MELTQLRYFLDVAATEQMTASADRLHIAQPALTQTIRRLEKDLGAALFYHKGRGIALTDCGKYLRDRIQPILKELDTLPGQLQAIAKEGKETVRLNVLAASSLVTEAVILYKTSHPSVNFRLLQNPQNESETMNADIEISTRFYQSAKKKENHSQIAFLEKIFLAVPADGRFEDKASIRLQEVEEEGFISLMGSKQFRFVCDKFCHHAGIRPKMIFESDSPDAVKNMIAAHLGIGFWPEFTWGPVDRSQVRLLEIEDTDCHREILITGREEHDSASGDFLNFLKSHFQKKQREAARLPASG